VTELKSASAHVAFVAVRRESWSEAIGMFFEQVAPKRGCPLRLKMT
jgi:hypothetical protein